MKRRTILLGLLAFLPVLAGLRSLAAGEQKITLPPETVAFRAAPGSALAAAHCLTCHSSEYLSMQPPMPRKFWEAEVKKMREKFGAPLPDDTAAQLVEYLTAAYGTK